MVVNLPMQVLGRQRVANQYAYNCQFPSILMKVSTFIAISCTMIPAVTGYYDNGQIFLSEDCPVGSRTKVIVLFLPEQVIASKGERKWNQLKGKIRVADHFDDPIEDMNAYM